MEENVLDATSEGMSYFLIGKLMTMSAMRVRTIGRAG